MGCVFSSVPGFDLQTVPRAEVWAPVVSLQSLDLAVGQVAKWDVDASYVQDNCCKVDSKLPFHKSIFAGRHGDIWSQVKTLIGSGSLPIPSKVTSHLPISSVGEDISLRDYFLNGLADALADKACQELNYQDLHIQSVEHNSKLAFLSCMRCTIVEFETHNWHTNAKVSRLLPRRFFTPTLAESVPKTVCGCFFKI